MSETLINIDEIVVNPGRRELDQAHVQSLADSMAENGLVSSITVGANYILIAGLHRLEAAKLLGWIEIECTVLNLSDLQAELAEIDENIIRRDLGTVERGEKLLRRKEIYEALHPQTKHGGDRKSEKIKSQKLRLDPVKSFVEDTAQKLDTSPRSIELQLQIAKNLTQEAKNIIQEENYPISQTNALKLSRMEPEQQSEAAVMLASGEIRSVDEYQPEIAKEKNDICSDSPGLPFHAEGKSKHFDSFAESLADIKNPDKDCSATPDTFLSEMTYLFHNFLKGIQWYDQDYYKAVFPRLDSSQIKYLHEQVESVCSAVKYLYNIVERTQKQ